MIPLQLKRSSFIGKRNRISMINFMWVLCRKIKHAMWKFMKDVYEWMFKTVKTGVGILILLLLFFNIFATIDVFRSQTGAISNAGKALRCCSASAELVVHNRLIRLTKRSFSLVVKAKCKNWIDWICFSGLLFSIIIFKIKAAKKNRGPQK